MTPHPAREYVGEHVRVDLGTSGAPVLLDLDFSIGQGEIATIVGRSGVGKTTLLRALAGLTLPTGGQLTHRDQPVNGPLPGVVTVFQDYTHALLPWRTVSRNVGLGLEGKRLTRQQRDQRVRAALEMVGLDDRRDAYPWQLSGGMQQRVQIARALAVEPQVLLMDEPFGALDSITKAKLQDELLTVRDLIGCTIVFITHDVDEAAYLGDTVYVLGGRPGTITLASPVEHDAPRDQVLTRESAQFLRVRHEVYAELQEHRPPAMSDRGR